jgi:hypothetical protein
LVRTDGFASVRAGADGGEFVTEPIRVEGSRLVMNYATSAVGSVRVEVRAADGWALEGYGLAQSPDVYGDEIARAVRWKGGLDVGPLAGRMVRLRFVMKDADLYSVRLGD